MNRSALLYLGLIFILSVASTAGAAQEDPIAIRNKYEEAISGGDVDTALALFADDAVLQVGSSCPPCVGKARIREWLEARVKEKAHWTTIANSLSGNVLTSRVEVRHDRTRKAGVERIINRVFTEVKGGKIVSMRAAPELSDPETARYRQWEREQTKATDR